jgi:hypothetical protein
MRYIFLLFVSAAALSVTPMVQQSFAAEPTAIVSALAMQPDTITLYGSGFIPSSVVKLNGQSIPALYVSPNTLKLVIPSGIPVGTYPVTVFNPTLGGGTSGQQILTISRQNDPNVALEYSYSLRQTIYHELDSTRLPTNLPYIDSKLLPTRIPPLVQRTQINGIIFFDGNVNLTMQDQTTDADNPIIGNAPITPERKVKQTVISSGTSSVTMFDAQGQVLNQGTISLPSYKPLIDSLRLGQAFQLNGMGPTSMTQTMGFVLADARSKGCTDSALGDGRYKIKMNNTLGAYIQPLPSGMKAEMLIDVPNNKMERLSLFKENNEPFSTTYFQYSLSPNGIQQPSMVRNEIYFKLAGGTVIKTVQMTEYLSIRYLNYVRR